MSKTRMVLLFVVLLIAVGFFIERKIKHHTPPSINAAGLVLQDLNGKEIALKALANKPMVLNFWGTWCGPCLQEIPGFEKAGKQFGDKVNIVLISDESPEKIAAFRQKNNYQLLYVHSSKPFTDLGIEAVPVTYFYNAAGELVTAKKSALNENELSAAIREIIQ
jgi:thiol-disulfide isomerase/thioredoxin